MQFSVFGPFTVCVLSECLVQGHFLIPPWSLFAFDSLSPPLSLSLSLLEEMRELREQPIDPQAEQEIIDSIEEVYFSNDSFDMVQHELQKLPPELNLQELEEYRDKLKRQQAAVSKKVADLILEKQPAYVKELERVTALQTNLQLAAVICTNARRQLSVAKEGFTEASLGLLANQRRRQLLTGLLKSLRTIKTLQRTDVRLSEMLEEEDYPGAIQLCLECQKAASTFKHYSCISELNSKLQDTLEQIEEQLDVALSKTCKHFDVSHYTKVQLAYTLLGKTQTAMDQLHMHFTQAIHNTVFQVVLGYVELCAGNADTKFQKMQYKDLCTHITLDSYIPCLTDLCKALWEVMLSYHRTMQWHEEHDKEETAPPPAGSEEDNFVSRETIRSKKKSDYNLNKTNAPILTNTTLNVIRLVGKYMQMMNILKPIAFDVIHCVSQLFDYYLYAVYTFFGRNDLYESSGLGLISSRLRTTLNRIQESLIDMISPTPTPTPDHHQNEKVPSPHLSQLVVLTNSGTLYGLAQRVVATESLVFLAEQFESLQSHLDTMMPAAKKPFLQQFYSQTVSTASELRKPIYWIVAAKAIDYEQMLLMMAGVKWDIREIMSQHNVYVDVLLKEFEQFNKRLGDVSRHVRIPLPVSNVLWEHCIRLANRTLVEGYANVKKCSNEGRALMQLDFQQFLMKLEKLTDLRPIPDKEFVETYIKAYYLTENDMEQFIKNHREYSMKQLANLVNVCLGSHINKKARQKLLAAIDDIDRPKR
uniref:VPS50 EARP/GARPII complex subunit n=1 Tax=Sphaeramia orbicularis TaxID=375764 RepID=A0A673A5I6_9TELE